MKRLHVSILLILDDVLEERNFRHRITGKKVSILLILDDVLEVVFIHNEMAFILLSQFSNVSFLYFRYVKEPFKENFAVFPET